MNEIVVYSLLLSSSQRMTQIILRFFCLYYGWEHMYLFICRMSLDTLTLYTVKMKFLLSLVLFICIYTFLSWLTIKVIDPFSGFNMGMLTLQQMLISGISVAFFNPPDSLMQRWGSFLIFCSHIIWVIPVRFGFEKIDSILGASILGLRATCMSIVILVIGGAYLLEKLSPKIYRLLSGGR